MTPSQSRHNGESVEDSLETILNATEEEVEALDSGVVKETVKHIRNLASEPKRGGELSEAEARS